MLTNNSCQSGQYILDEIHSQLLSLRCMHCLLHIHIEWVPGHLNIEGNECADKHAKEAALGMCSPPHLLPSLLQSPLPDSISTLKVARKQSTKLDWLMRWKTSPRHAKLSWIDPTMPCNKAFHALTNLPCHATSILMQLHTGHVALHIFLKKIKATDLVLCPCCLKPESVSHFLLHCKKFTDPCFQLRSKEGKVAMSLSRLLSNEKVIPHTLHYIVSTKRLEHYAYIADHN